MKKAMKHWLTMLLLAAGTAGCDVITRETRPEPHVTGTILYTVPNGGLVVDLLARAEYRDATELTIARQPANGRASFLSDARLLYLPDTAQRIRSDYFLLRVQQHNASFRTDTVVIHFVPADSIPCQSGTLSNAYTVPAGAATLLDVLANDRFCEGAADMATFAVVVPPQHGTVTRQPDNRLLYTPRAGFSGTDYLIYKLCNDRNQCSEAVVTLTVQPNNCKGMQPDTIRAVAGEVLFATTVVLTANDRFCTAPLDSTTVQVTGQPANGVLIMSGGSFTYTPNRGFTGTDSFTYRACTVGGDTCGTANATILVAGCTAVLRTDSLTVSTAADSLYTHGVLVAITRNDTYQNCAARYTWRVARQPAHGTAAIDQQSGLLRYTPNTGFKGTDTLEYSYCDSPDCLTPRAIVHVLIE